MDAPANKLVLDLSEQPGLRSYFAEKNPGDTCEFDHLAVTLDDLTNDMATFSVNEVSPTGYTPPEGESDQLEPSQGGGDDDSEDGGAGPPPAVAIIMGVPPKKYSKAG